MVTFFTLLASGCAPIPDVWPEAEAACVELDEGCIDVLRGHFGADLSDENLEVLYLQGMRWFVRWDIDGVELDFVHRAPGEGTTRKLYNHLAWHIVETVDNEEVWAVDIDGRTAKVGDGISFCGMPYNIQQCLSVPAWVLHFYMSPDADLTRELFSVAGENCQAGTPPELTDDGPACFSWIAWAEYPFEANWQ